MNRVEEHLRKMAKPNLELPKNHARLRQLMLKKFEPRSNTILHMFLYKLLPTGLALTLILVVGATFLSKSPEMIAPVSADEIINDTIEKVQNLSEAELNDIKQKIGNDEGVIELLKSARSASDLKIVNPTAFSCGEAQNIQKEIEKAIIVDETTKTATVGANEVLEKAPIILGDAENCENASIWKFGTSHPSQNLDLVHTNGSKLTYLEYTKEGNVMILGLDEKGLPLTALNLDPHAKSQTIHDGENVESMKLEME